MKEELAGLLEKYYRGETSLEEEKLLKEALLSEEEHFPEKDFFSFCAAEAEIPADLHDHIFDSVDLEAGRRKTRFRIYSLTSVAASMALIVSLYSGYRSGQKNEFDFRMIEQALYNVSETLQPEPEEPDMPEEPAPNTPEENDDGTETDST